MVTGRTDPRVLRSRATVLNTALRLLGERGIAATTIESVAEQSGVGAFLPE
jgi:AcrR family transcriptional regulator